MTETRMQKCSMSIKCSTWKWSVCVS